MEPREHNHTSVCEKWDVGSDLPCKAPRSYFLCAAQISRSSDKNIVLLGSVVRWQINTHSSSSFTDFVLLLHETRIVWVENTVIGELFEIFALRTSPLCRKDGHKPL